MADLSARVIEVRALAETLWFLPPPAKGMIADKLHGLGVRVHPEAATLELQREGPKEMGNHAPQTVVKKAPPEVVSGMLDVLRQANPDLAERMDAAGGFENLTDEQRKAFAAEAFAKYQATNAEANARMDASKPEDFEPGP
jgi:hypothetical protein